MDTTFETNRPTLLKLCWLISQQWKAEIAYNRAQYRVAYYRKLKAKLETSKKSNEKWNDHIEIAKKIEAARLVALKKQKQLMDAKKRLQGPIATLRKKLNARFSFQSGKVIGVEVAAERNSLYGKYLLYDSDQIAEMADQYEAEKTLNKALTKEGKQKL